jgi:hypothetical protein
MDIKKIEQKTMNDTRLSVARLMVSLHKCETCIPGQVIDVPKDVPVDLVAQHSCCGHCQLSLDEESRKEWKKHEKNIYKKYR